MIRAAIAVALLLTAMLPAQASSGNEAAICSARVIRSEELPFAPMGYWLVRATLEVSPPGGLPFEVTFQDNMPWQGPPPRMGQTFRVRCDPANPRNLSRI
jgi:hypothetical protein